MKLDVLYCTVLYVVHCVALYCTVLYCTLLYYTAQHCTVVYCITRHDVPGKSAIMADASATVSNSYRVRVRGRVRGIGR